MISGAPIFVLVIHFLMMLKYQFEECVRGNRFSKRCKKCRSIVNPSAMMPSKALQIINQTKHSFAGTGAFCKLHLALTFICYIQIDRLVELGLFDCLHLLILMKINLQMDKEICTIFIGKASLDDDYTFYESGKIKRFYDRSIYSQNNEEWLEAEDISIEEKKRLFEKCKKEHIDKVRELLK